VANKLWVDKLDWTGNEAYKKQVWRSWLAGDCSQLMTGWVLVEVESARSCHKVRCPEFVQVAGSVCCHAGNKEYKLGGDIYNDEVLVWCSNMIIDPLRSVKASDKAAEREHYFLPSPVSRTGSRAVIRLVVSHPSPSPCYNS
jgi:hypothetical protein